MRSFYCELLIINVASLELESCRAKDNPLAKIDLDFSFLVSWLFKMFKTSKTFLVFKYFCFRGYHLKQLLFEIMFWKNPFFLYQHHKFLFGKKVFATNSFCPGSISHSCYQYQHQYFDNLSFSICQKHPRFENFIWKK